MELFLSKLETERTILRQFEIEDFDDLFEMMSNIEVMKNTGFKRVHTEEETKDKLSSWSRATDVWACVEKESGKVIGWFMLKHTTSEEFPELGYMIAENYWGRGFATEVSKGLIDYAFNDLKFKKVIANTSKDNSSSIKVLQKIGMEKDLNSSASESAAFFIQKI